jgi:lysophospholipase L1-like esterase
MEPEVADLLAELAPCIYILDPAWNMSAEMIDERAEDFVRKLRNARSDTPILMVENYPRQNHHFVRASREGHAAVSGAYRRAYDALIASGMEKLYWLEASDFIGADGEGTVDGVHATDMGFTRMADKLEPVVRRLMS